MTEYASQAAGPDFKALFEAMPGLYLVLDKQLRVVAASDAYLAGTMTVREEILGLAMWEIFPDNPDDPTEGSRAVRESQQRALASRKTDTMAVQKYDIPRPDGSYDVRYWSPMHVPVLDAAGEVRYVIHRVEDVTEFIQLKQQAAQLGTAIASPGGDAMTKLESDIYMRAQEVSEANRKLREIDRLKTNFFANISHELRTPLTLILGPVARMLETAAPGSPHRSALEIVERNARFLLKQVNDLLDIAKLEAGNLDLDYIRVDMAQMVRMLAANFESLAQQKHIALTVRAPETLVAEIDDEKFQRVLLNLLSNAFKFTPSHGVIEIAVEKQGDMLIATVSDSGPGIPAVARAAVFERFRQLEGTSGTYGGTGLGLAIVKEFVGLHYGTVDIEDSALGGAAFVIRQPLAAPEGTHVSAERLAASSEPALVFLAELRDRLQEGGHEARGHAEHGGLVLVVDDNADMREHLTGILAANHRIETAANGFDGLNRALELLPDLVISDVMMPVMNGAEMAHRMMDDPRIRDIPLLMLTAKMDDDLKVSMLREGVRDYLAKPFAAEELSAKAARLVAERRRILSDNAVMIEKLTKSNQDLERFAYATAHDLKSPLRSIHNLAGWIAEDAEGLLGPDSLDHLERLRQQARRMEKLLNDMLDYSTIGTRPHARAAETVDGATLARDAVALVDPPSGMAITFGAGLAEIVVARMPLQQILVNLVQNAVVHHDKPQGRVAIDVVAEDEDLVFSVTDDGPGIAPEFHEAIFEMFQSLKPRMSGAGGGSGMGLALARKLAASNNGRISVESVPGRGSTFRVRWPIAKGSGAIENGVRYA